MTRKKKAASLRIWEDSRAWKIVGIFVVAGPTCAFLIATIFAWIVSGTFSAYGLAFYPFIYLYLGIPCLLMGIVAALSFHFRERVLLSSVLLAAAIISTVLFVFQGPISFDNRLALLNHLAFIACAGLGSWLLVHKMRKQST